jgi:hypothetical protein
MRGCDKDCFLDRAEVFANGFVVFSWAETELTETLNCKRWTAIRKVNTAEAKKQQRIAYSSNWCNWASINSFTSLACSSFI